MAVEGKQLATHHDKQQPFFTRVQKYHNDRLAMTEEAVQKWGGYINFQDTFAWRNLQSYAGLVKSRGTPASLFCHL